MNPRIAIADLDMRWTAADLLRGLQCKLDTANAAERARAWQAHGPRTAKGRLAKIPATRERVLARLPEEVVTRLQRRAQRRLELYAQIHNRARRTYCDARDLLLRELVPVQADRCEVVAHVSSLEYSSQGLGKYRYARERAQRDVDTLVGAGIDAFIGECSPAWGKPAKYSGPSCFSSGPTMEYAVNARCERVDLQAARLRDEADMPELVRRCWARGVNPRVYWPLLPHGYEAQHGIDFQGRRVAGGAA